MITYSIRGRSRGLRELYGVILLHFPPIDIYNNNNLKLVVSFIIIIIAQEHSFFKDNYL